MPKQKDQAKPKERGRGEKTKNKPKGQDNGSNGSPQSKKKQNDEKNVRGRSRSSKRFLFVEQWPKGKHYLNKSGSALTAECDAWFSKFCYKCRHSSHTSSKCKTYPENNMVLTLCETCLMGFHSKCRNYHYSIGPEARINNIENLITNWNDSRGGNYWCPTLSPEVLYSRSREVLYSRSCEAFRFFFHRLEQEA